MQQGGTDGKLMILLRGANQYTLDELTTHVLYGSVHGSFVPLV
jgi:hypothetical protein